MSNTTCDPQIGDILMSAEIGMKSKSQTYQFLPCVDCGTVRWVHLVKGQPTRERCRQCAHDGARCSLWNGGRIVTNGYYKVWVGRNDFYFPMVEKRGRKDGCYVLEHRLVMAKHLNRCLLPWEIVHHRNGIRGDNRLENLELLPSASVHLIDTISKSLLKRLNGKVQKQEKEIMFLREKVKELEHKLGEVNTCLPV